MRTRLLKLCVFLVFIVLSAMPFTLTSVGDGPGDSPTEAPTGFDGKTNGLVEQGEPLEEGEEPVPLRSFEDDKAIFEELETIQDGLGPTYNAQSCGECHQNPVTGGISQITELRAGQLNSAGRFVDLPGGSLIHSRAIDASIQERISTGETIRASRTSLNTLGDGFVECIADSTLESIAAQQPVEQRGQIIRVLFPGTSLMP